MIEKMILPIKIPTILFNKESSLEISDCYIRQSYLEDYSEISEIQDKVVEDLLVNRDDNLFISTEKDKIKDFLERDDIFFICVQTPDVICAYSYTFFNQEIEYDLSYFFKNEKVATFDSIVVLPQFRGNKLQDKLLKVSIEEAKRRNYNIMASTVSPDNIHSINNFIKNGFEILKIIEGGYIYGSYKRYVVYKILN